MTDSADLKQLPFSEALGLFIESRKPYISPKTYREGSRHVSVRCTDAPRLAQANRK
jgi:hypothetical protein